MVFGHITNGKPNDSSEITHFFGFEEKVKAELEPPENDGSGDAHHGVEDKCLAIMYHIFALESEDVTFIQYVFEHKANACPDDDGCYQAEMP